VKNHPYEYRVLVEYVNPEETGRYPHFTRIEDQDGLSRTLNEVFAHLPASVEAGWEVNSHNITVSRNTLIITVLLRRPKQTG
jgi:neutral trehalase